GTEVTLVRAAISIEHDHAPIAVSVGNRRVVGFRVPGDARRTAQMRGVATVGLHAALADLQQKLAVLGEFQDLSVAVAVARQPDIILVVDSNAVLAAPGTPVAVAAPLGRAGRALDMRREQSAAIEPVVLAALGRTAPALDVTAGRAELQNGWGRHIAIERGVIFLKRVRAVEHPDIAMGICGRSAHAAQQHPVRHGGKTGIHVENRQDRTRSLILRSGYLLKPAQTSGPCEGHQRVTTKKSPSPNRPPPLPPTYPVRSG